MRGQRKIPQSSAPTKHAASSGLVHQRPHPAVVRVVASAENVTSMGSGTLVHVTAKYGIVITNWHVVRDVRDSVEVIFPDGFRSQGTVMKIDEDWDLAAIGIWRPQAEAVKISTDSPQRGEELTIAGYGNGSYRAAIGRCTQYVAPGKKHPFEMLELSAEARQGDSGGPIFNARGELAGVLLGAKKGHTVGSFCGRVDLFLFDVHQTLHRHQAEQFADGRDSGQLVPVRGNSLQPAVTAINPSSAPSVHSGGLPTSARSARSQADWQWSSLLTNVLGSTPADQFKTFLATIGAFSLVICGLRLFKFDA